MKKIQHTHTHAHTRTNDTCMLLDRRLTFHLYPSNRNSSINLLSTPKMFTLRPQSNVTEYIGPSRSRSYAADLPRFCKWNIMGNEVEKHAKGGENRPLSPHISHPFDPVASLAGSAILTHCTNFSFCY